MTRGVASVTESREYGNPIHSQNDVHSQNASYCHFESLTLIFKVKILRSNLNKSPYYISSLDLCKYVCTVACAVAY